MTKKLTLTQKIDEIMAHSVSLLVVVFNYAAEKEDNPCNPFYNRIDYDKIPVEYMDNIYAEGLAQIINEWIEMKQKYQDAQ